MPYRLRLALALPVALVAFDAAADPAELRKLAHDYYRWRDDAYPVATSDAGDHRLDDRLTDFRMAQVIERRQHVQAVLTKVRQLSTAGWSKDDRIDRILFEAQLSGEDFFGRELDPERENPQLYVDECSNGIFSLLKKEYAPHSSRALAADVATRADAGAVANGPDQSHQTGEALRAARDPGRAGR